MEVDDAPKRWIPSAVLLVLQLLLLVVGLLGEKASAAHGPIPGPDMATCRVFLPPDAPPEKPLDCCFMDLPIVDFEFQPELPVRVRRPAHKFGGAGLEKYERAMALMRALPGDDPRSHIAQSRLHCTYCQAIYMIANSTATFQVHFGSLFPYFHRWYTYFHERILASLIGDDTLAIPYWAWDVQNETAPPANVIPPIFSDPASPLFDPMRSAAHQPPCRVDLELVWKEKVHNKPYDELVRFNYHQIWRYMVAESQSPEAFLGGDIGKAERVMGGFERFHIPLHYWTGSDFGEGEDMAPSYTAARDPIFFAHHTQTDRMFEMWRDRGGGIFDDPEWLDARFLFYDEFGRMVRVRLGDAVDMSRLRYEYEQVPSDWLDHRPTSIRRSGDPKYARAGSWAEIWRRGDVLGALRRLARAVVPAPGRASPPALGGARSAAVVTARVARAGERRTIRVTRKPGAAARDVVDEVLVIGTRVTKPFGAKFQFHAFLELPEADEATPRDCVEYLGPVIFQPDERSGGSDVVVRETSRKLGMGERLRMLGVESQPELDITFVKDWDAELDARVHVQFTDLRFETHHMVSTA